jgi:cell division septation protein DedD
MDQPVSRRRAVTALVAAALGAGLVWVLTGALPGAGAGPNPPGNNGTVKIDGVAFDDHPDNEPHVGCVFQVDWYGFDEGELFSDVTFEVHPPTGSPEVILTDEVFIGDDDNSGGGSEAGLDASETYDLSALLQGVFEPHPNQGWHIKLTINSDGSQGADVKHKVFWVSGCETPPTTSTTSTTEKPTTTTTEKPTTTTTDKPTTTTTDKPTTTTTEKPTTTTTDKPTTTTTDKPYP